MLFWGFLTLIGHTDKFTLLPDGILYFSRFGLKFKCQLMKINNRHKTLPFGAKNHPPKLLVLEPGSFVVDGQLRYGRFLIRKN